MARTVKKPKMKVVKKGLTKRQESALKRHTKGTSQEHKKFMKRRLLMGDTIRQAHKMYKKKNG
jgi:hypothetical protein